MCHSVTFPVPQSPTHLHVDDVDQDDAARNCATVPPASAMTDNVGYEPEAALALSSFYDHSSTAYLRHLLRTVFSTPRMIWVLIRLRNVNIV
jgi:hypothetical protein